MKQYRVIGASIFFCLSFLGCKNYENQKDKMIRFVCDYKAMQDEFNRILFAEKRAERTGLKVVTADTLE